MLPGIDVSSYQGRIDWPRVASSGVAFAAVKLTEGTAAIDRAGLENLRGAAAAGLRTIAYHFLTTADPEEQARHFLEVLPSADLVAIDLERGPSGAPSAAQALGWLQAVQDQLQATPLVYTGPAYAAVDRLAAVDQLGAFPLWIAHYTAAPSPMPCPPWTSSTNPDGWTIWQYSGSGRCPGVPAPCDLNRARALPAGMGAARAIA